MSLINRILPLSQILIKHQSNTLKHVQHQMNRRFSISNLCNSSEKITLKFKVGENKVIPAEAKVGDNILDVIVDNEIDIDGFGACEGTLACSTCHLVLTEEQYTSKGEPSDEELDMLDLALGLQDTSRLGCQVIVTKEMDNWVLAIPDGIVDAR